MEKTKTTDERIASAMGAISAIYKNTGPDVAGPEDRTQFALAAIAASNIAVATAIADLAEAVRDRD